MRARVSAKGWVVIPAKLRHKYSIRPGDEVRFVDYGGVLSLVLSLDEPAKSGRGMLDREVAPPPPAEAGARPDDAAQTPKRRPRRRRRPRRGKR